MLTHFEAITKQQKERVGTGPFKDGILREHKFRQKLKAIDSVSDAYIQRAEALWLKQR